MTIFNVGWCYVSLSPTSPDVNVNESLALFLSYELWTFIIIGLIIFCVTSYVVVHCCKKHPELHCGLCPDNPAVTNNTVSKVYSYHVGRFCAWT